MKLHILDPPEIYENVSKRHVQERLKSLIFGRSRTPFLHTLKNQEIYALTDVKPLIFISGKSLILSNLEQKLRVPGMPKNETWEALLRPSNHVSYYKNISFTIARTTFRRIGAFSKMPQTGGTKQYHFHQIASIKMTSYRPGAPGGGPENVSKCVVTKSARQFLPVDTPTHHGNREPQDIRLGEKIEKNTITTNM